MRILHAISNLSPQEGGPPNAGLGMARAIARRDHDVAIYTTNFNGATDLGLPLGEPFDIDGVEVGYYGVFALFLENLFRSGPPTRRRC